jgi:hypothetical protein
MAFVNGAALGLAIGALIGCCYFYTACNERMNRIEESCDRRFKLDHGIPSDDEDQTRNSK